MVQPTGTDEFLLRKLLAEIFGTLLASEPRDRSERGEAASERVGGGEGEVRRLKDANERSEVSHRSGAGRGAPASDGVGEFEGRSPSINKCARQVSNLRPPV